MNAVPFMFGVIMASVFIFVVALCWILLAFMPRWTRPDIYFSVTVKPSFRTTPEALQIERRYRRLVAVHSLIGLALSQSGLLALAKPGLFLGLLLVGLFWQMGGSIVAFVRARRQVLPHAATPVGQRQAVLQPRRIAVAGRWWWLGPLLILLGFALYLTFRWNDIPDRFPIHWGPSGSPDSSANRGFVSVFAMILMGICMWATMFVIAAALPFLARHIHARGAAAQREQRFMHISQWIFLCLAYWLALVMGTVSLSPLLVGMNDALPSWIFWIIGSELILVAVLCVVLARSGQGGWRLDHGDAIDSMSPDDQPVGDRTPDSAWKLGLFYFNPDDPAILVEKRFGIGWDLNWGRPAAWLSLLGLLLFTTIVPIALLSTTNATSADAGSRVVDTFPVHGTSNVDPELVEIRICFDQPMDQSFYSITPGGAKFPKITGEPRWLDDRTFVLPVHTDPGQMYEIMINKDGDRKFRSQTGSISPSSVIDFETAPSRAAPQ